MRKLPVLLLTLILASAMPINVANALETGEDQGAINGAEGRATTEVPVIYELDQRMHIQEIKPREGLVDIEVTIPIGEQLEAQRIWLATFDYENGWTEAEVDESLGDWTMLKADWTKAATERKFVNAASHFYATMALTIEGTRLQYDLTAMNLPDVLYYAAEFKDLADGDAETFWVRGKVDYRGCVHAQRFKEWQTGTCVEMVDWNTETTKYLAAGSIEDEEVVTWEEEWRSVLAGRISEVGVVLDGLAMMPDLPKEALAQSLAYEEEKLAQIETLLVKATGVEGEIAEAARLRERMVKMLNDTSTEVEKDPSDGGDAEGSAEGGAGASDGVGAGNGSGVSGNGPDNDFDGGLDSGFGSDDNFGSGSNSVGETVGDLNSPVFSGVVVNSPEEVAGGKVEGLGGDEGGAEADSETISKTEAGTTEVEVEVPRLGGMKANKNAWIWWVIGLSGALALFLAVVLKRKQRK